MIGVVVGHENAPKIGVPVEPDSLFTTAGNSQALDFVCSVFTRPGDTVICEEPSYFLAFRIFEDHGLEIVPVPTNEDGMDVEALENVLDRTKPKLVYTIPSYHNPGGQSLSAARRERLAALDDVDVDDHDHLVGMIDVEHLAQQLAT